MALWTTASVVLLLTGLVSGQDLTSCYDGNGVAVRCEPSTQSFSFARTPQVNSTCGIPATSFCTRTYDVVRDTVSSDCSNICDANDPANAHPPELMTDFLLNDESWWQSENSLNTQNVVVVDLALETLVEVRVITFDFASFHPNSFYILKSDDFGSTYTPYHYFATSCIETFGIDPDLMLDIANETTVLCQTIERPQDAGSISFFPLVGRPSTNDSIPGYSSMLFDFLTATDIRVVLLEHYPIPNLEPDDFGYYYAINDLNLVGSCQCNGHASSCGVNFLTSQYECDCQHNTTGSFCDRCADFYQDRPWTRANGVGDFECRACNCNGHSTECVFDPAVYRDSGETSGGVCVNCQDNTAGRQCEECATFYYRVPGIPNNQPLSCQACNCQLAGVSDNGECVQESGQSAPVGQCSCKPQVTGLTCGQCTPGFFNLSMDNPDGCQECGCIADGSLSVVCDVVSGVCDCKPNIVGDKCDQCLPGFYQPNVSSSEGCLPCDCNPGGSFNSQCDLVSGQCDCRTGIQGRTCSETIPGYFYPSIDFLRLEAEDASSDPIIELSGENELFTGTGYGRVNSPSDRFELGYLTIPVNGLCIVVVRYTLQGITVWDSVTLTITPGPDVGGASFICEGTDEITSQTSITLTSWSMGSGLTNSQTVCLRGGRMYRFTLHDFNSGSSSNTTQFDIDSLFLVPVDTPSLDIFDNVQLASDYMDCVDQYRRVITQASANPSCASTIFTVSAAVYNGTMECSCDDVGTQRDTDCEPFGGQCFCLPGVRGRQCDQCRPGSYNFTSTGCSDCSCDAIGSLGLLCDLGTGECDCLTNIVGRDCSVCAEGFTDVGTLQCVACGCDPVGSVNAQCDQSLVCVCKPGVAGVTCDRCEDFHYGFQDTGCRSCDCDVTGSLGANCSQTAGQCSCVENTMGRDCSTCRDGTFNLQESNPHGCQSCFCSGLSSRCESADGFVRYLVTTIFNSSALGDWEIDIDNENETFYSLGPQDSLVIQGNLEGTLEAPNQFIGNKLSSYGQYLLVGLSPLDNGSVVEPLSPYDVLLVGQTYMLVGNLTEVDDGMYAIQLHEDFGWLNLRTSTPVTSFQLQQTLSSLRRLLLSINFNTDVVLSEITLVSTTSSTVGDPVSWVEQCNCPVGYDGLSCEQCAQGYTRTAPNTCEPCQCNGFTNECDPENGFCINCTQSTTGPSCEHCQRGTFGDPTNGISCDPCPCPLTQANGQFSDECILLSNGQAMCTNCPSGHVGQNCESCRTGYFGDPTGAMTGQPSMCTDCLCNGNIDRNDTLSCNATTGICTRCLGNTAGDSCEQCADGFYGDAITAKNCSACNCDPSGSESAICNIMSGQCSCFPNVDGLNCERCISDYYGFGDIFGCLPCNCSLTGSVSSQCGSDGQCTCLPGVTGMTCDQCLPGYFNFTSNGCQECSCSPANSQSAICETNGECICLPGSTGPDCRQCIRSYFQTNGGCTECPSCYQEIEDAAEDAEILFTSALNELNALRNMLSTSDLSPLGPRLSEKQQLVDSIVAMIDEMHEREGNLTERLNDLTDVVMQALQVQTVQIQALLDQLRRASTTVFVLASTSNELVDRIIFEFSSANELLAIFRNEFLPVIEEAAQRIEASFNATTDISTSLNQTLTSVSQQVAMIQDHLMQVRSLLTYARQDIDSINYFFANTSALAKQLDAARNSTAGNINGVRNVINYLSSASANVGLAVNSINYQPDIFEFLRELSHEFLRSLISLSNMTEMDINTDISNAISSQQEEFGLLNQTLVTQRQYLDALIMQFEQEQSHVEYQSTRSQELKTEAYVIFDSVYHTIDLADTILENLQQFSNNSLQISIRAQMALEQVQSINETAALAQNQVQQVFARIGNFSNQLATVRADISEATDIVSQLQTQQEANSLDASSILATESSNLERANSTNILEKGLSNEVQVLNASIATELNNVNSLQQAVEESEARLNTTQALHDQAQMAVSMLQDTFRGLQLSDSNAVNSLETFLENVEASLSSANIYEVTEFLRNRVVDQRNRRLQLENIASTLQQQVDYLNQLHTSLPTNCTS